MATTRLRTNFLAGVIENSSGLNSTAEQLQSSGLAPMGQLPDNKRTISLITLDPFRRAGPPEVVSISSHVPNATTAIIARAQDNTFARPHAMGTEWLQAPLVSDWTELDDGWQATQDAVEEAVRRRDFSGTGQLVVGAGPGAYTIKPPGPESTVLVVRTTGAGGLAWEALTWDSLSSVLQDMLVPAGSIQPWLGAASLPPPGWLLPGVYPKLSYPRLDAVLAAGGYPWGQSVDESSFIIPVFDGRVLRSGDPGASGGSDTATLSVDQLARHTHPHTMQVLSTQVETDARVAREGEGVVFQPATYADLENMLGVAHVPDEAPQLKLFEHSHELTGKVEAVGGSAPFSVMNRYLSVRFLVKT